MTVRVSCQQCGRPKANARDWRELDIHQAMTEECPDGCAADICWIDHCPFDPADGVRFTEQARCANVAWATEQTHEDRSR